MVRHQRRTLRTGSDSVSLSQLYDVALLDLDGVVYLGRDAITGAADALANARESGLRLAYVTNNASRTPAEVAKLLTGMAIPASPDDVITSAQAAAHLLADRLPAHSAVLVVGAEALADAVAACGLRPVRGAEDRPAAVVQGFDRGVGWVELAEAAVALRRGALWVATNADTTLPSDRGPLPGTGAMVAALRTATGLQPVVVGKPEVQLHADAVARTGADRPLVVGDRLDTDILGATRGGSDSLLVLTGISTAAELLMAGQDRRPTYVAADLAALCSAQPAVHETPDAVTCGGYRAAADGHRRLRLQEIGRERRSGDPVDALRALCVAWWNVRDQAGGSKVPPPSIVASGNSRAVVDALGLRLA